MAAPVTRTWVAGEIVTDDLMNTYLRDPINFLLAEPRPGVAVARLVRTTASTISNGVVVPFNAEDYDDLDGHSTVSNTSRYTPPIAGGRWLVLATLRHDSGGAVGSGTPIFAQFQLNGVPINPHVTISMSASLAAASGVHISDVIACPTVGDYIEVTLSNNQAQAINCQNSMMTIVYAGPIP